MKVKPILILILTFSSLFVIGCTVEGNGTKEDNVDTKIINTVLDYMEQEDWHPQFYPASEWESATVKKVIADDRYKNLDKAYFGQEIYTVTIEDALAAPIVFVDPDTLTVIGIMPGE